jgi:hypothetical protein
MKLLTPLLAVSVLLAAAPARADDTAPPVIKHSGVAKAIKGESVTISAQMEDESEIFAPTLYFRYPGGRGYSSMAMTRRGDEFVASVTATADIEYWIEAYDEFGNGPAREAGPDKPHKITVTEKAAPVVAEAPKPAPVAAPEAPREQSELPPPPPPAAEPAPPAPPEAVEPGEEPIYTNPVFLGVVGGSGAVAIGVVIAVIAYANRPPPLFESTISVVKPQ